MTAQIWIALATANFFACLAPGQNAALMGAAAARSGPIGGGFAMLGILLAELAWAAIAIYLTFGARELAGDTFVLLQIASAGVLIWFGIGAMREGVGARGFKVHRGALGLVGDGIVVGLANPLALVFFLSVFPAFVPAGTSGSGAALFFVSAILGIVGRRVGALSRRRWYAPARGPHQPAAPGVRRCAGRDRRASSAEGRDLTGLLQKNRAYVPVALPPRSRRPSRSGTTICQSTSRSNPSWTRDISRLLIASRVTPSI